MTDPGGYAYLVRKLQDGVLATGTPARELRAIVSASWQRSLAASIDPDQSEPPHVYAEGEVADLRAEHPLAPVTPALRAMLVSIADEAEHIMIIADAAGHVLWRGG